MPKTDRPATAGAQPEPDWSVLAWSPKGAEPQAVLDRFAELQHLALAQRDAVLGLEAELRTAREALEALETTEVGRAFRRIDKLEEQREVLLHKLRLGRFGEDDGDEVAALKASATWRVGRVFVAPIAFLKSRARR